jgi:hypothetical protein
MEDGITEMAVLYILRICVFFITPRRGSLCALLENSASTTTPDADWPLACWILLIGNWRANLQQQCLGPTVEAYVGLTVTGPWAHSAWTTLVEVPSFVGKVLHHLVMFVRMLEKFKTCIFLPRAFELPPWRTYQGHFTMCADARGLVLSAKSTGEHAC